MTEHEYAPDDPETDDLFEQWYTSTWITVNSRNAPLVTHLICTKDDDLKLDILTQAYRAGYAEGKKQ
jgi:hypothetical protein